MKLNVSAAKAFLTDQMDWYYAYHLRRVPRGPVMPLALGTVWHVLMENYFSTGSKEEAKIIAQLKITEVMAEERGDWAHEFQLEAEHLFHLFDFYEDRYAPEETLAIESAIEAPLGTHILVGRPDTVIRWRGKLWHRQNRTLSDRTLIPLYLQTAERDLHEVAYAGLIAHRYGIPLSEYGGTLMNIVRKVSKKKLMENPDAAFVQEFIPITPQSVLEALGDLEQIATDMEAIIQGSRRAVSNREQDRGRFGNRLSPYFEVKMGRASIQDNWFFRTVPDRYEQEAPSE
jgi:hypothetical protein